MRSNLFNFYDYIEICRNYLKKGSPEGVDLLFGLMYEMHPEFRQAFAAKLPGLMLNHYFYSALDRYDKSEIIQRWVDKETDWDKKLKDALNAGHAGKVAYVLRESLLTFAEESPGGIE